MTPWISRKVFSSKTMWIYRLAEVYINNLPDLEHELRCHELARVVWVMINCDPNVAEAMILDGTYGAIEHSWLMLRTTDSQGWVILDVYAVGRVPQVQLIDGSGLLPEHKAFKKGEMRGDIDGALVDRLVLHLRAVR